MNTADRSIHLLDTALRRRFEFIELLPTAASWRDARAVPRLGRLPRHAQRGPTAARPRKQIGHALFFADGEMIDTPEAFAAVFRHELLPLLEEYPHDDYKELADMVGPLSTPKPSVSQISAMTRTYFASSWPAGSGRGQSDDPASSSSSTSQVPTRSRPNAR